MVTRPPALTNLQRNMRIYRQAAKFAKVDLQMRSSCFPWCVLTVKFGFLDYFLKTTEPPDFHRLVPQAPPDPC